jgi:glycosyltransferase involved in cell wall biosynthesis
MKVLFVTHTAQKYGASRSLLALIDGLLARGVTCYVVIREMGPFSSELTSRGIAFDVIPFKLWATTQRNPIKHQLRTISHDIVASLIARKAKSWGVDVIHTNSSVTPVGALAARKAKIPHIWHIREYGEEDYGLTYDNGFKESAQMMADLSYQLVIISEALAKKYKPYVALEKFKVVYNPVVLHTPATLFSIQKENSTPQAVMIGFLHPTKGFEEAIIAVAELLNRGRQINLNIVGDGDPSYKNSLQELVEQHNVKNYVTFHGYLDEPGALLQAADVMLVCSRSEAFGRVTVEGMLHKKPIVAARAGANAELIEENTNGLLYEPGKPVKLANAIAYLLDHPQQAREMGENGFSYATETFTIEKHTDAMYDLFCAAQNGDSPPAARN